jgi:thiamine biosynthesis protein ThiI
MRKVVLVRYGEIALKSTPTRVRFEKLLLSNIRSMVGKMDRVYRKRARIVVETDSPKRVSRILSRVPGVVSCSPAVRVPSDLREITEAAVAIAKRSIRKGESFSVRTSREGRHGFTSIEVSRVVGERILHSVGGSRVDLSSPDREIFIDIRDDETFIFTEKAEGVGGLPVGSEGRVICIFGGEPRDANAALLMMKRGCAVEFLSSTSNVSLVRMLLVHHPYYRVFICRAKLGSVESAPVKVRSVLRRMLMLKVGGALAERRGASCLVSPDGLREILRFGLKGIELMDRASAVPVLRPLLGQDLASRSLPKGPGRVSLPPPRTLAEFERELSERLEEIVDSLTELEVRL